MFLTVPVKLFSILNYSNDGRSENLSLVKRVSEKGNGSKSDTEKGERRRRRERDAVYGELP